VATKNSLAVEIRVFLSEGDVRRERADLPNPDGASGGRASEFAYEDMVGATGPQQFAGTLANPQVSCKGAAKSAATFANSDHADPDLAYLVDSWSCLPPSIKAGIVAMVKVTSQQIKGRA
jgi:hypothetical protein